MHAPVRLAIGAWAKYSPELLFGLGVELVDDRPDCLVVWPQPRQQRVLSNLVRHHCANSLQASLLWCVLILPRTVLARRTLWIFSTTGLALPLDHVPVFGVMMRMGALQSDPFLVPPVSSASSIFWIRSARSASDRFGSSRAFFLALRTKAPISCTWEILGNCGSRSSARAFAVVTGTTMSGWPFAFRKMSPSKLRSVGTPNVVGIAAVAFWSEVTRALTPPLAAGASRQL